MTEIAVLPELAAATEQAAALLQREARPAAFTSWPELKSRFDAANDLLAQSLREARCATSARRPGRSPTWPRGRSTRSGCTDATPPT